MKTLETAREPPEHKRVANYCIDQDEIDSEVPEPASSHLRELEFTLKLMEAEPVGKNENIFKDALFWFAKGFGIQKDASRSMRREDNDSTDAVALDYYKSGIKVDNQHIGCIYNTGCCEYFMGKYANAEKWFLVATRVDPGFQDGYLGHALASMKLGLYQQALKSLQNLARVSHRGDCPEFVQDFPEDLELLDTKATAAVYPHVDAKKQAITHSF